MDIEYQDTNYIIYTQHTKNFIITRKRQRLCNFISPGQKNAVAAVKVNTLSFYHSRKCQLKIFWQKGNICFLDMTQGLETYSISTSYDNHQEHGTVNGSISIQKTLHEMTSDVTN